LPGWNSSLLCVSAPVSKRAIIGHYTTVFSNARKNGEKT
jgi:hypothetical protein